MTPIFLYLLSLALFGAGAVISLMLTNRNARRISGGIGLVASLVGLGAALLAAGSTAPPMVTLFRMAMFGDLTLTLAPLSAFFVGVITVLGAAASLYSISYLEEYEKEHNLRAMGFFTNLFLAAMMLVVTVTNAFYFLLFWEMMTLTSYFLVTFESEKEESIRAGYLYLLIAHAGSALIMAGFLILYGQTGSFEFAVFRQAALSPAVKNVVFLLAFLGFGAKAGMVPLHIWLPRAHPAAPSHISALMSGVMIKTAVYGILLVGVTCLGTPEWWWGGVVLGFGGLSAVLGIFYALAEHDLKRLLAYSSVENIGIIFMGVGLGMIGLALQQPVLAVLGLLAALYHLLNHAFFKGALFLGAGAVIGQVGTKNLNRMGGLARQMPWTALIFLVGALSISAMPPFNGFVSEWFTYQAFFLASATPLLAVRVFAPLFAVLLALAGAFTVMVYIKAYGGAFTGPARSPASASAREVSGGMRAAMAFLALGCLALGVGASWITPWLSGVAANLIGAAPVAVSGGWTTFPADADQAVLSTPLIAILLVGLMTVPVILVALFGGSRAGRRTGAEPWTCGYGYSAQVAVSASSFDQPVRISFQPFYRARTWVEKPLRAIAAFAQTTQASIQRAEPVIESIVTRPTTRLIELAGQWIQALQMGDIRVYCLYIILTLAILLIAIFGRSGL